MSESLFDDIVLKCVGDYKRIRFIWHGGEPLLMPVDFFVDIANKTIKYQEEHNIKITNSVQTNGTLLSDDYLSVFSRHEMHVGFSFDGRNNDLTRGCTEQTLLAMAKAKESQKEVGAIKVVTKSDLNSLVDEYLYFKSLGFNMKLNPMHDCDNIQVRNVYTPEEYSDALFNLFEFWKADSCAIKVEPFEGYISMIKGDGRRSCTYNSCLTKFIGVTPSGDIYPCSRYYPEEFCFGNVVSVSAIRNIFDGANFRALIESAIIRRDDCARNCALFEYCQGGCNHDAMLAGNVEKSNSFSCQVFRSLFPRILASMS
jgi:uncharacterized protein